MRLCYSYINMSTGPCIFIQIKKVNGELINIGSLRTPLQCRRGPPGGHGPLVENPCSRGQTMSQLMTESYQVVLVGFQVKIILGDSRQLEKTRNLERG